MDLFSCFVVFYVISLVFITVLVKQSKDFRLNVTYFLIKIIPTEEEETRQHSHSN